MSWRYLRNIEFSFVWQISSSLEFTETHKNSYLAISFILLNRKIQPNIFNRGHLPLFKTSTPSNKNGKKAIIFCMKKCLYY